MQSGICYLFGAGSHYGAPPKPKTGDFVMAIDGGLSYLQVWTMVPDLLVGDLDSLEAIPTGVETIRLPKEKDDTDMLAGLRIGLERGYGMFHIYGGTGGRFDHTMANIQCLAFLAQEGVRGYLFDEVTVMTAICRGGLSFSEGGTGELSAFSLTDISSGVCEEGFAYSLKDAVLQNTFPLGVSNQFIGLGVPGRVWVESGTLLLVYPKETLVAEIFACN